MGSPFREPDMTPGHHHTTKSTLTKLFPLKFLDFFDRRRPMQPNLTTNNSARPGEDSPVIRTRRVRRVRGRVSESIAPRFQRPPLSHGWHLCFGNKIRIHLLPIFAHNSLRNLVLVILVDVQLYHKPHDAHIRERKKITLKKFVSTVANKFDPLTNQQHADQLFSPNSTLMSFLEEKERDGPLSDR